MILRVNSNAATHNITITRTKERAIFERAPNVKSVIFDPLAVPDLLGAPQTMPDRLARFPEVRENIYSPKKTFSHGVQKYDGPEYHVLLKAPYRTSGIDQPYIHLREPDASLAYATAQLKFPGALPQSR